MEDKRIFICGPSGTGKTTLGEWIAATYRIPFISTSGKVLWDKLGIKDHAHLIAKCNKDISFAFDYQLALLDHREQALRNEENFVTDRSPVDNLVYYLMQVASHATDEQTNEYIERCHQAMRLGNKLIYTPFNSAVELEDDGARVNSRYFQMYTSGVFDFVIEKNLLNLQQIMPTQDIMNLNEWDWYTRMERVKWLLQEPNMLQRWLRERRLKRRNS